ncbi:MAG: plasmid mobilization relaxosome protein MobC [Nitrosomonas sp.]|nr:MAG: plasmid mobilization relaxosome protein MobC [Nitrosomonas sp.]
MDGAGSSVKKRSETRQKTLMVGLRATPAEYAELKQLAEREGLSVASYIRSRALAAPTTRARRRPPIEAQLLGNLLAQLGKIGSNLNQIARGINQGELVTQGDIQAALGEHRQILASVIGMLGKQPK